MPSKSRVISKYHTKQVRQCKYCSNPCARVIEASGRNKGFKTTCGSHDCFIAAHRRPEVIAKKTHIGANHSRWIHDRNKIKTSRPRTEQTWWRKAIFERDKYTCQICEKVGGNLQADHILPYASFPEYRWDLNNGRTLCIDCHKNTDTYARKVKRVTIFQQNQ